MTITYKPGVPKGGAVVVWFDWNWGKFRDHCVINFPYICEEGKDLVWDLHSVEGPLGTLHAWNEFGTDNNGTENYQRVMNNEWVSKVKVRQYSENYYNGPALVAKSAVNGDNAYYIPETAGLTINTGNRKESFGVSCTLQNITERPFLDESASNSVRNYISSYTNASFGNDNASNETYNYKVQLTIPNLEPGWYVKLYWSRHAVGSGESYTATGVTDLEGRSIDSSFPITSSLISEETNDYYGATTFIVKRTNGRSTTDVSFYLQDSGWSELYKIVVCKDFRTEFRLVSGDWYNRYPVVYDKEQGKYTSDNISLVTIDSNEEILYTGWPQYNRIQNAHLTDWEVTPDKDNNQDLLVKDVDYKVEFPQEANGYVHCKITALKDGTRSGNLLITQRSKHGNYVLDKNETWIAIGRVTPKKYPYTWDFTEYNMSDDRAANWQYQPDETGKNINSNTFWNLLNTRDIFANNVNGNGSLEAFRLYGSWGEKDGTYYLYTYPKTSWEYWDQSGYHSGSVPYLDSFGRPMDKPLFAQGSQFVYATYDNNNKCTGTANVKEFEGLGMTVEAIGEGKYGHIEGWGNGHLFGVKEILIPAVPAVVPGMSIFMETASDMPEPTVYVGNSQQEADTRAKGSSSIFVESNKTGAVQKVSTKVYGWKIPNGGDVRITGLDPSKKIYRIGVTNLFKTINKYGYATESRNVPIDHMMTSVFGKADAHPYVINEFTSDKSKVNNKEQIGYVTFVPAQASVKKVKSGQEAVNTTQIFESIPAYTGVILWTGQTAESSDDVEVPLFYPACNVPNTIKFNKIEKTENNGNTSYNYTTTKVDIIDEGKNLVKPTVTTETNDGVSVNGANGDFILTNVYAYRGSINNKINGTFGDIGFYYSKNGTLSGNKSYLHLDNAESLAKTVFIFFEDINNEDSFGITTGAELPNSLKDKNNDIYYNLNGLQLNGQPTMPGIYVKNGKKVVVK